MSIRLATYNIHACIGADRRFDPERIARVLQELDADVIALQEVDHHAVGDSDVLGYLAKQTGLTAIAGHIRVRELRQYGNALLTKLPIVSTELIDLCVAGCEPRGALEACLDWNGSQLQVIATHLGLRPGERRQQVRRLLRHTEVVAADYSVLFGDINEWLLWGRPLRWLHRRFAAPPHRRTFPARWPLFALDRIWARPRVALSDIQAHQTPLARIASDHLPLKARLSLLQPAETDQSAP